MIESLEGRGGVFDVGFFCQHLYELLDAGSGGGIRNGFYSFVRAEFAGAGKAGQLGHMSLLNNLAVPPF